MPKEPPKREVNPLLAAELASMQQGLRKVERKVRPPEQPSAANGWSRS
jgi:hypothetical protein